MKRRTLTAVLRPKPRIPSVLADAEIRHLEKVVQHLSNTGDFGAETRFGLSYWLHRIEDIESRFHLVPSQLKRLAVLRETFASESAEKPDSTRVTNAR